METTVAGTYLRECYAVNQDTSILFCLYPGTEAHKLGWNTPASISCISQGKPIAGQKFF